MIRRRPKLHDAITRSLNVHFSGGCADAAATLVADLDDAGYDIIEKRTRRREKAEQDIDHRLRVNAEEDADSARRWGERLAAENQRLSDRITFLYEKAVEHGATREELTQETPVPA